MNTLYIRHYQSHFAFSYLVKYIAKNRKLCTSKQNEKNIHVCLSFNMRFFAPSVVSASAFHNQCATSELSGYKSKKSRNYLQNSQQIEFLSKGNTSGNAEVALLDGLQRILPRERVSICFYSYWNMYSKIIETQVATLVHFDSNLIKQLHWETLKQE